MFRVLPEFLDLWSSDGDEVFVSRHDIEQLSSEWGVPVDTLLSQVELCDDYFDDDYLEDEGRYI